MLSNADRPKAEPGEQSDARRVFGKDAGLEGPKSVLQINKDRVMIWVVLTGEYVLWLKRISVRLVLGALAIFI